MSGPRALGFLITSILFYATNRSPTLTSDDVTLHEHKNLVKFYDYISFQWGLIEDIFDNMLFIVILICSLFKITWLSGMM